MTTFIKIRIVTSQDSELAEEELRKAIAKAGYDVSDFAVVEEEESWL